jgi:Flp pilus assembly protein TadB
MTNDSLPQKKGRPTPKRKDAESARKVSSLAPAHSKEAKARQKAAARAARVAQRAAYLRGDENALPLRDRGPVRRFVRNYVDSRRSIGEFFLPIIAIVLVISLYQPAVAIAVILMYTVLFASVIDGILLSRRIKREITTRFPSESLKGLGMYGWLRSTQMRRMRAPKPGVASGEKI